MGQTNRVEVAPTGAATGEQTGQPTRRQVSLGFRTAAWVTAVGAVAVFVFALLEVVLMWLPDATLLSVIEELTSADLVFRVQFFAVGVAAWTVVLGLVAQLVRPARHVAGIAQSWGAAAAMAAMLAVVGAFGAVDVVILLGVTVVVALHPSRTQLLARPWRLDRWQAARLLPLRRTLRRPGHARYQSRVPSEE